MPLGAGAAASCRCRVLCNELLSKCCVRFGAWVRWCRYRVVLSEVSVLWSLGAGAASGCHCKVVLSECCYKAGEPCCHVAVWRQTAVCALSFGVVSVQGAVVRWQQHGSGKGTCCPQIPFVIWGLCGVISTKAFRCPSFAVCKLLCVQAPLCKSFLA